MTICPHCVAGTALAAAAAYPIARGHTANILRNIRVHIERNRNQSAITVKGA